MPIAITEEQSALAESVVGLAARHAAPAVTRSRFESIAQGDSTDLWTAITGQGLHAIGLPESVGGQGAGLIDVGVVVEEASRALLPGSLIPSLLCCCVVDRSAAGEARDTTIKQLVEGARGLLVDGSDLVAATTPDGWRLNGTTSPVPGALAADILLVRSVADDGPHWFVLDSGSDGVSVRALRSTDLTTDLGAVTLDGTVVPAAAELIGPDDAALARLSGAFLAAEAAGLMRWAWETVVDYAKIRRQFDRPIGSFQAVKHKCARLFVAAELGAAAAFDALTSFDQDERQQDLAVGAALVVAVDQVVDALIEAIGLLGGIGFTWEHDAHLYLRRAIGVAARAGSPDAHLLELGRSAQLSVRKVEFALEDEDPKVRRTIAELLGRAAAISPGVEGTPFNKRGPQRTFLADNALVSPHWPRPWGMGATPVEQVVIAQEYAKSGVLQPSTTIGEWAMPTIFAHGTPEQAEKFGQATLRGDIVWCQLFSEPGAGSDLAGVSTRAVKVDGGWLLSGQKVWTSGAQWADWGICLARSDGSVPKHEGLSFFLVDMRTPGIDVRPLMQATGRSEFNEVFLDDVFVPDDMILGRPGDGWRIAATTLANERTAISLGSGSRDLDAMLTVIRSNAYRVDEHTALRALGDTASRAIAISALNTRAVLKRLGGIPVGAESSVGKVATATLARTAAEMLLVLIGPDALQQDEPTGMVLHVLDLPQHTIGGGTVEIHLNVIAERILGLPRG